MRHLLPLLSLVGCSSQGVLVDDVPTPPRQPVSEVFFGQPLEILVPQNWSAPKSGDIDGDGIVDLVATTSDGAVEWLRGDGDGGFERGVLLSESDVERRILSNIRQGDSATETMEFMSFDVVDVDLDGLADVQLTFRIRDAQSFREVSGVVLAPTVLVAWQTWTDTPNHRVTTVADLDGDGRVEWVEFSATPAVHTSTGQVWPLTEAVSWVFYPHVGVVETDDETLFVTMVDGGFGISQIERWAVTEDGLVPRESIHDIYAHRVVFGEQDTQVSPQALMVTSAGIDRFDGQTVSPALEPNDDHTGFFNASIGDFSGDGGLDVLVVDGTNPPRLYASTPQGQLADMTITTPPLPGYGTLVVDLNGDGLDDLVQVAWRDGTHSMLVWLNES